MPQVLKFHVDYSREQTLPGGTERAGCSVEVLVAPGDDPEQLLAYWAEHLRRQVGATLATPPTLRTTAEPAPVSEPEPEPDTTGPSSPEVVVGTISHGLECTLKTERMTGWTITDDFYLPPPIRRISAAHPVPSPGPGPETEHAPEATVFTDALPDPYQAEPAAPEPVSAPAPDPLPEPEPAPAPEPAPEPTGPGPLPAPLPPLDLGSQVCVTCEAPLTAGQITLSLANYALRLCPTCQKSMMPLRGKRARPREPDPDLNELPPPAEEGAPHALGAAPRPLPALPKPRYSECAWCDDTGRDTGDDTVCTCPRGQALQAHLDGNGPPLQDLPLHAALDLEPATPSRHRQRGVPEPTPDSSGDAYDVAPEDADPPTDPD